MREAAREVFEAVEDKPFGAYLRTFSGGRESEIAKFLAAAFATDGPLHGATPPARVLRLIDHETAKNLWWIVGTDQLGDLPGNHHVVYENVSLVTR